MEYLQRKFKGKRLFDLLLFLNNLDLEGLWCLSTFGIKKSQYKNKLFFQMYHKESSNYVLAETHEKSKRKRVLGRQTIDLSKVDEYTIDNIYTASISGIEDVTQAEEFEPHILNLLPK
jgi:hypothetical protein